jgi:hypothetical protein
VVNGFVELAEFFECAAQVVAGDAVERIDLHGGEEAVARVGELAHLVVGDAEIDVRFDPVGREVHYALIIFDGLGEGFGARFTIERGLKEIFGSGADHGVQFLGLRGEVKRKSPLAQKRIEGTFRAGGNDVNFAAEFDEAKFLNGHGSGAKLRFHQGYSAADAFGRDVILSDALDGAQGDEVAETVEALAPAGFGAYETQTLPVAKTVRLKTQDAPNFISRISLRQSARPPLALVVLAGDDYAPGVKSWLWYWAVDNLPWKGAAAGINGERIRRGKSKAMAVSHLRRSRFFCMHSQTFRSGLTYAAPTALVLELAR